MAHFDVISVLRTRRTNQYDFCAVLEIAPNCTHGKRSPLTHERSVK